MQHSWGFVSIRFPKRLPLTPSLLQPLPAARGGGGGCPAAPAARRAPALPWGPPAFLRGKRYPKAPGRDMDGSQKVGLHSEWFYFAWGKK